MDLLPKSSSDFSQLDYWNKFFKSRGSKAFEWYGTYHQLCTILHKYMTARDNILVGGCGNSTLSADLYNSGFTSITNVDISETVIKQMNEQYSQTHPLMKFIAMDLLNMDFTDGSFSCFLDKGTLDALMSDASIDSKERAIKMFQEIERVLRLGGRYICVSLLQEHILQCLFSHFHQLGWMIRVCRCEEAEHSDGDAKSSKKKKSVERYPFPVFVVICTKFKKMDKVAPIVEYCPNDAATERLSNLDVLIDRIKSVQQFALVCHQMTKENQPADDLFIELMDPKSGKATAKYTLFVVDRRRKSSNKFAAFVVPQGRETEWMFNSNEGRRHLADNANFQRLVVIHLGREHHFESLECVQNELAGVVSSLQPSELPPNSKIPFLSLGAQVNQRREVHRGCSDLTGEFVIEEVEEEGSSGKKETLRRLIFLSNPNTIQSEARLIKGKVDLKFLSCRHHHAMVETLQEHHASTGRTTSKLLVLGLGGGALCTYLHRKFPATAIDGVDIDPAMPLLATKYFGFTPDHHLRAHIGDGVQFVKDVAAGSDERYGCIMIDVDCKDRTLGMSCPPPAFVEPTFLEALKSSLTPDGLFLLNLVCRDANRRNGVIETLRELFRDVKTIKIKDEVNEIIACYPNSLPV